MTRAELIDILANKKPQIPIKHIEEAVKLVFERMSSALEAGQRIEVRGFGSFDLRFRSARVARNPKTGEYVNTDGKYVAHFKPGKELRERVNEPVFEENDTASD